MTKNFSGVVVPMITPLLNDLRVDTAAVKRIMKLFFGPFHISAGIGHNG
jgi:dihydrodipicolinate synthase/N-acetylneuraminate lyase